MALAFEIGDHIKFDSAAIFKRFVRTSGHLAKKASGSGATFSVRTRSSRGKFVHIDVVDPKTLDEASVGFVEAATWTSDLFMLVAPSGKGQVAECTCKAIDLLKGPCDCGWLKSQGGPKHVV